MSDTRTAERVGRALTELRRGTAQDLRSRLYGEFVDLAQADALQVIGRRGGCKMSELAAELRVDASTATRTVRRLSDSGLVERAVSPSDARAVLVSLTDEGLAMVSEISRRGLGAVRTILDGFTAEERAQLAFLLEKLVQVIDAERERAAGPDPLVEEAS